MGCHEPCESELVSSQNGHLRANPLVNRAALRQVGEPGRIVAVIRWQRLVPAGLAIGGLTVAAIALPGGLGGPSATSSPAPVPTATGQYVPIVGCIEDLPSRIKGEDPRDGKISLPNGSYLSYLYPTGGAPGIEAGIFLVPVSLDSFVTYVLDRWPKDGWTLGHGEREAGEAESVFFWPDRSMYGQFRARAVYCDSDAVEVTLTLGRQTASPAPNKGTP